MIFELGGIPNSKIIRTLAKISVELGISNKHPNNVGLKLFICAQASQNQLWVQS